VNPRKPARGSRPRVVVVDDDASIRRLVEMALETLPVELVLCASVPAARAALRERTADLLITDLMMPGETGVDLLHSLQADPALRGNARLAVFSAGLDAARRAELQALGVWRLIDKPVSTLALEDCVCEALGLTPDAGADAAEPAAPADDDADAQAAAAHFGGDVALFRAFRDGCLAQFPLDRAAGDAACAAGDTAALRRVAHNLKSVLRLLGHDPASRLAARLEQSAADADAVTAKALWASLRDELPRPPR
jgi:CheY-like chemotaxis protein